MSMTYLARHEHVLDSAAHFFSFCETCETVVHDMVLASWFYDLHVCLRLADLRARGYVST